MEKGEKIKFKTKKGEILEGEFLKIYIYKKNNKEFYRIKLENKQMLISNKQIIK